jgi:transcriptional regulator with XRE-family HTH domain
MKFPPKRDDGSFPGDARLGHRRCMTSMKTDIKQRLRDLRRSKRLTQEGVAEALGLAKESISGWETGKSMPSIVHLPLIAQLYGVSTDYLLTGKNSMPEGFGEKVSYLAARDDPALLSQAISYEEVCAHAAAMVKTIFEDNNLDYSFQQVVALGMKLAADLPATNDIEELHVLLKAHARALTHYLRMEANLPQRAG